MNVSYYLQWRKGAEKFAFYLVNFFACLLPNACFRWRRKIFSEEC